MGLYRHVVIGLVLIGSVAAAYAGCEHLPGKEMLDSAQISAQKMLDLVDSQVVDPKEVVKAGENYIQVFTGPPPAICTITAMPNVDSLGDDKVQKSARDRISKLEAIANDPKVPTKVRARAYLSQNQEPFGRKNLARRFEKITRNRS
jgi:hypothetical protein